MKHAENTILNRQVPNNYKNIRKSAIALFAQDEQYGIGDIN
jgi:hypothetical protein